MVLIFGVFSSLISSFELFFSQNTVERCLKQQAEIMFLWYINCIIRKKTVFIYIFIYLAFSNGDVIFSVACVQE